MRGLLDDTDARICLRFPRRGRADLVTRYGPIAFRHKAIKADVCSTYVYLSNTVIYLIKIPARAFTESVGA